jgi:type I restriction enzyme S subunit
MKSEIVILERQRMGIERQKRGLMQKLLTGEWRVKVKSEKEAAA